MKMNLNYNCQYRDTLQNQWFDAFLWQTLNVQLGGGGTTCTYSLNSPNQSFPAAGGNGTLTVNTQTGCPWTVGKNVSWINISSNTSGSGPGTITFSVAANPRMGEKRRYQRRREKPGHSPGRIGVYRQSTKEPGI